MVGRPKEFDERQALDRAMEVFWVHGYEASSVQDLLDAMGINRGSMYDTFGDKHALFTAAIEHYGATVMCHLEQSLAAEGSPLDNIREVLTRAGGGGKKTAEGRCCGCLATNAIVELAPHDPNVAQMSRDLLKRIERAFAKALERARGAGELSDDADTRALARFLVTTLQGLVVMAKASTGRGPVVRDSVEVALAALG
ncbi:MAG: TetR/AcrR family transcriptional regulator [Planctomycetes bacterium]|nr:TetR/AcrR family transcriptional regulator [Planctomycetota bacterium]